MHYGVLERMYDIFCDAQWKLALAAFGAWGTDVIDRALNDLDAAVQQFETLVSRRVASPPR